MNLTKITLKSIKADKSKDFINALENLPERTIQGDTLFIEAYQHLNGTIILHVMCNENEFHQTKFNAPNNSKIFGREKNKLWFNYDHQSYKLEKYVSEDLSP